MSYIYEQNGGAEKWYVDDNDTEVLVHHKTRSFVIKSINNTEYDMIKGNISWLRYGDGKTSRSGGMVVKVFYPGERMSFDRELITIDDYHYPDRVVSYSTTFTDELVKEYEEKELNNYRLIGLDMIWCRENELFERLNEVIQKY